MPTTTRTGAEPRSPPQVSASQATAKPTRVMPSTPAATPGGREESGAEQGEQGDHRHPGDEPLGGVQPGQPEPPLAHRVAEGGDPQWTEQPPHVAAELPAARQRRV